MKIPRGFIRIPTAGLSLGFKQLIKNELVIVADNSSSFTKEQVIHQLFIDDGDYLGVPRGFYQSRLKPRGVPGEFSYALGGVVTKHEREFGLRDGQPEIIEAAIKQLTSDSYGGVTVEASVGSGKCHGRGTKILMFDGSIKSVEDIIVGDQLMGPDSKPRNVLSLASGSEEMYRVIPAKGDSFVCNESHILSLRLSGGRGAGHYHDEIINLSISDYLKKPKSFAMDLKLWRCGADFNELSLPFDPYFVGLWIADGSYMATDITKPDKEIKTYLESFARSLGMICSEQKYSNKCPCFSITSGPTKSEKNKGSDLSRFIKSNLCKDGIKHIPKEFLINSEKNRLSLLAGLLDGDGCYHCGYYEISTKHESIKNNILFLARSLGLAAYAVYKKSTIKSTGFEGWYYRVTISGEVSKIPCIIERKKASDRKQKKNALRTGFTLEKIGYDKYFGFNLDGDHLYLLGDFTVTHNTILGLEIARQLGLKTIILVPTSVLMEQWIKEINRFFPLWKVGRVFASTYEVDGYDVCVSTIQSTSMKEDYPPEFYEEFGAIIVDEVHKAAAKEFSKAAPRFGARYLIGLSGTTKRADKCEKVFIYTIGKVIPFMHAVKTMQPEIYFVDTGFAWSAYGPMDRQKMAGLGKIIQDPTRNILIVRQAVKAAKAGRRVLILSERVNHVKELTAAIRQQLMGSGLTVGEMVGTTKQADRDASEKADVIVATVQLIGTGFNCPPLSVLIFATPIQNVTQAIGRIQRTHPGKPNPIVIDLVDTKSGTGVFFAQSRFKKYIANGWRLHGTNCFEESFLCRFKKPVSSVVRSR